MCIYEVPEKEMRKIRDKCIDRQEERSAYNNTKRAEGTEWRATREEAPEESVISRLT